MAPQLKVALLQLRAHDLAEHRRAWKAMFRAIEEAAVAQPDLIVLPEATYPAYFLGSRAAYDASGARPDAEVLGALADAARQHGCYIAAGLVLHAPVEQPDEHSLAPEQAPLQNVCVVFNRQGIEIARAAKTFLWHFDGRWFRRGGGHAVFDLDGTPAGALICADGRLPEVARTLTISGARILIDSTAWVSSGRDAANLQSPMVDHFMRARAIENGVWVLAADKVGVEAGSIVYAGRSGVISPQGEWLVQAPSDRPGIVTFALDPDEAQGPPIARRPELYSSAALPLERSEVAAQVREPLIIEDAAARVAAIALDPESSAVELMERCRDLVRALAAQDCPLVVLPDLAGRDTRGLSQQELLPQFIELSAETRMMLAVGLAERANGATYKSQYLLDAGRVVAVHRQTHLDERELEAGFVAGNLEPPVIDAPVGYIGLLSGSEGLVPEMARSLKLRGAEILVWSAGPVSAPVEVFARARAGENRAYVVAAGTSREDGGAFVVDPEGTARAASLRDEQMAVSADINRAFARWNDMAPRTNPIRDRDPAQFANLFR